VLDPGCAIKTANNARVSVTGPSWMQGTLGSTDHTGTITCGSGVGDRVSMFANIWVSGGTLSGTLHVDGAQIITCTANGQLRAAVLPTTRKASVSLVFAACPLSACSPVAGCILPGAGVRTTLTIDTTPPLPINPTPLTAWVLDGLSFSGTVVVVGANPLSCMYILPLIRIVLTYPLRWVS